MEASIQSVEAEFRAIKLAAEANYSMELTPDMAAWTWGLRHAAWLNTRFSVRVTGRTAYQEAYDTEWRGDLCTWLETVLFQESAIYTGALVMNRRRRKADATFTKGVWVGRSEDTNEHIVCTADGAFLTRSVKRLLVHLQADEEMLKVMRGTPWGAHAASRPGRKPATIILQRQ